MTVSDLKAAPESYYEGQQLTGVIRDALERAGLDPGALDIDELAALDEFHAQGRAATMALAALSDLAPGMTLLDAGAGIGGPSRYLAARHDLQVTAVDATERFCAVNEMLCRATGLHGRVQVLHGSVTALPHAAGSFERVWTQALIQNIADKAELFAELNRVLVPGGMLSMFEVLRTSELPPHFPVPWGDGPEHSFLVGSAELRALTEQAGFEVREWLIGAAAVEAVGHAAASVPAARNDLDLSLLMPHYEARMAGLLRNVAEQRIELAMVVLVAR
jgi:ubiquinone/menaquinone biosynthesis C-methylase UbiE